MISSTLTVLVLTIAVSGLMAVIIHLIVVVLGRIPATTRASIVPPPATERPAQPAAQPQGADGIPAHHLVIIAAACDSLLGHHRVVHIESSRWDSTWASLGRQMHHGSHRITRSTRDPR